MIDTHAHLNDKAFDLDREIVIEKASHEGIETIIDVSDDIEAARVSLGLFKDKRWIWSAVGLHPHVARRLTLKEREDIRQLLKEEKVIAVGEVGLDYFYQHQPREIQKEAFSLMLDIAIEEKLPVLIHNRDSDEDLVSILSEKATLGLQGLIHCFGTSWAIAKKLLDLGFYISFSGIVTFKNAGSLRDVVRQIPLDRILVETDAPYLAPVPMRGKRNEPAFVRYTAEVVANLKEMSFEDFNKAIGENVKKLFPKMVSGAV